MPTNVSKFLRDAKSRDMSWSRDGLEVHFYCLGLGLGLGLEKNVLVLVSVLVRIFIFFISAVSEYSTRSSSAYSVVHGHFTY